MRAGQKRSRKHGEDEELDGEHEGVEVEEKKEESEVEEEGDDANATSRARFDRRREVFAEIAKRRAEHFALGAGDALDDVDQGAYFRVATPTEKSGESEPILRPMRRLELQVMVREWPEWFQGPFLDMHERVGELEQVLRREASWKPDDGSEVEAVDSGSNRKRRRLGGMSALDTGFDVPSLEHLCLNTVSKLFDHVEELGDVPNTVRSSLAWVLARDHRLSERALGVLGSSPADEWSFPDLGETSDSTLVRLIRKRFQNDQHSRGFARLALGHCGRALTDRAARAIAELQVLQNLQSLRLGGAYQLSDGGLRTLVSASSCLEDLGLSAASFLGGGSIRALHELCPGLRSLRLDGCGTLGDASLGYGEEAPRESDDALIAAARVGEAAEALEEGRPLQSAAAAGPAKERAVGVQETADARLDEVLALASRRPAPLLAEMTLPTWNPTGIMALEALTTLELVRLPRVSDEAIAEALFFRGMARRLHRLVLRECPLLSNTALEALAAGLCTDGPPPALRHLELDSLPRYVFKDILSERTANYY